jgi:hypothetical protein
MNSINLADWDIFFYYGQLDTDLEIKSDLLAGIMQPKRSMFYNRADGAGASDYENYPNTLLLQVGLRYDIANWVNYNNTQCSDGTNDTIDRRVAVSQNSMEFTAVRDALNINVYYIRYADMYALQSVNTRIGIGAT